MGRTKEKRGKRRRKEVKGVEGGEGKGREGKMKMKEKRKRKGKGKGEMVPHFLVQTYKVTPMSASDIHTRRIRIATRNHSALFMMSYTASQQPATLQLQDIEDIAMTLLLWMMLGLHLTVRT